MNCRIIELELDGYLNGTLRSDAVAALERHATGCSDCSDLLDRASRLRRVLANLPLIGRGADAVEPERATSSRPLVTRLTSAGYLWYFGAIAAGITIIGVLAWLLLT